MLASGRWLLRPLFHEIASSNSPELFTFAVLFVAIGASWATHAAGLSFALGAFLAGMMLAETEYRYQVEAGIRPFRDTLLGLFFVTIGMQLDVPKLLDRLPVVLALLATLLVLKAAIATLAARPYAGEWFKALRTGIVLSPGGEFGFALLALLLDNRLMGAASVQPLLAAITLSMLIAPVLIRHNKRIARLVLRQSGQATTGLERIEAANQALAKREHVILCGYGRVGQNVGRVLENEGFEFLAVDLDPVRVRAALAAGDAVIYGDAADEGVLKAAGLDRANSVVVTFSDTSRSLSIVRAVRHQRKELPILVRAADDTHLEELIAAGATEVVPETLEAALTLVSNALHMLRVPASRVIRAISEIRGQRYKTLRSVIRRDPAGRADDSGIFREELHTVVLPPGAWSIGRTISEVRDRGAEVSFTAVRRDGIVGRDPDPQMTLREGDIVILFGTPEAQEHAEAVLSPARKGDGGALLAKRTLGSLKGERPLFPPAYWKSRSTRPEPVSMTPWCAPSFMRTMVAPLTLWTLAPGALTFTPPLPVSTRSSSDGWADERSPTLPEPVSMLTCSSAERSPSMLTLPEPVSTPRLRTALRPRAFTEPEPVSATTGPAKPSISTSPEPVSAATLPLPCATLTEPEPVSAEISHSQSAMLTEPLPVSAPTRPRWPLTIASPLPLSSSSSPSPPVELSRPLPPSRRSFPE